MGEMTRDFAKARAVHVGKHLRDFFGAIERSSFVIVNDPSRSNLFGRAYSKSFSRKVVLKVGIFLQAIDKANAAGGVWANPKWVLLPYET